MVVEVLEGVEGLDDDFLDEVLFEGVVLVDVVEDRAVVEVLQHDVDEFSFLHPVDELHDVRVRDRRVDRDLFADDVEVFVVYLLEVDLPSRSATLFTA